MTEVYALKVPNRLDPVLFDRLLNLLDSVKKERIARYLQEEDRLRCLFADLLVRSVIMQKTGLSNNSISFGTNAYGKPYLEGFENVHFNVSHSGIWVVVAFDKKPVGVDVEQIAPVDLSISRNFFSEAEHQDLMNQEDKLSYFFTLWTLKESYIKVLGKGLSHPLNQFSVKYQRKDDISIETGGRCLDGICFAEYDLQSDYKMVLCATHNNLPKGITLQSAEGLIRRLASRVDGF